MTENGESLRKYFYALTPLVETAEKGQPSCTMKADLKVTMRNTIPAGWCRFATTAIHAEQKRNTESQHRSPLSGADIDYLRGNL